MSWAVAAMLWPATAGAQTPSAVAVVAVDVADEAAASELGGILGGEPTRRRPAEPHDVDAIVRQAGEEWPEPYVVVFDVGRAVVRVLRPEDGMVLYRPLEAGAARDSPYSVALAAAGLLDIAATTPLAEAAAVSPPPATERRPEPPGWALGLTVGGVSVVGLSGDLAVYQPVVGLELVLDRRRAEWFGAVFLTAAVWGVQERSIPSGAGPDSETAALERHDLALAAALGRGIGPAALLLSVELGFALSRFTVADATGSRLDDDLRGGGWAGIAAAVRLDLGVGFFVQAGTGLAWTFEAQPYAFRSTAVFDAGDVQLRGTLALGWDSA